MNLFWTEFTLITYPLNVIKSTERESGHELHSVAANREEAIVSYSIANICKNSKEIIKLFERILDSIDLNTFKQSCE